MPESDGRTGILITVAPIAGPIGHLLRTAIDAEQVGARRLHLPADQPELAAAVSALREQTELVLTGDEPGNGLDVIGSAYVDVSVPEEDDLPALVAEVAKLVSEHPAGIGLDSHGRSALPVLLATLAAGGHVRVPAPELDVDPVPGAGTAAVRKDHAALVARAAGLARIAGRPPLSRSAVRQLLGLA